MRNLDSVMARLRRAPRRTWALSGLAVAALAAALLWPRRAPLDPSAPDLAPDDPEPPPAPLSTVAAPLRVPLESLTALLEEAVPVDYGDLSDRQDLPGHGRTDLAFHLERTPFRVALEGASATIRTNIAYQVRIFYDPPVLPEVSGSCGTDGDAPAPRLAVTIRSPIALDRAWRLRTHAQVVAIGPASETDRDRCSVTFLDVDVTDRIVDAARKFLAGHTATIDSLAASVDVRSTIDGWWRTLQEPIRLTDSLWLAMRPEAVKRGPTRGTGDSLEISLALGARPTIVYGSRPDLPHPGLPPLDTGRISEGLDLRVEARAEYGAASDLLNQELVGRVMEHDGRRVRLDSVNVFGIGAGRLAVELRVSGDVSGRLYLVGTPEVDPVTGRISVPDLDFDLATRDVVVAAAAWLRADELRDLLRAKASWPAAPAVEFLTGWLEKGLNRELSEDLRVEGTVGGVRILGVRAMRDALLVRVSARGAATLFVGGSG